VITGEHVAHHLSLTKVLIGEAQFNLLRDDLSRTAVSDLIDQHLMMQEFRRLGGALRPEYVDRSIDDLVDRRYQGSKGRLAKALGAEGISMAELRQKIEELIVRQALESQQKGEPKVTEAWKEGLRNDAEIQRLNEIRR